MNFASDNGPVEVKEGEMVISATFIAETRAAKDVQSSDTGQVPHFLS